MTPVSTYKQMLLMILDEKMSGEAQHLHIQDLEDYVIANGLDLPIVRLPTHYLRGVKWFTNRGNVALCNCGAIWPCSQAKEINHVQNEAQDT